MEPQQDSTIIERLVAGNEKLLSLCEELKASGHRKDTRLTELEIQVYNLQQQLTDVLTQKPHHVSKKRKAGVDASRDSIEQPISAAKSMPLRTVRSSQEVDATAGEDHQNKRRRFDQGEVEDELEHNQQQTEDADRQGQQLDAPSHQQQQPNGDSNHQHQDDTGSHKQQAEASNIAEKLQSLMSRLGIELEGQFLDQEGDVVTVGVEELPATIREKIVEGFQSIDSGKAVVNKSDGLTSLLKNSKICLRQASLARWQGKAHPIDGSDCACQPCSNSSAKPLCLRALSTKRVVIMARAREFRSNAAPGDEEFWIGKRTNNASWKPPGSTPKQEELNTEELDMTENSAVY